MDDEKLLSDLRQDNWNLAGKLIMARERIAELECQNKIMEHGLRRLEQETKLGLEIMGTMTPRQM